MHATIRRYEGVAGTAEELAQALRQIGPRLREGPHFVSIVVLDGEAGVLTVVGVSEDPLEPNQVDGEIEEALRRLDPALSIRPQVTSGEILYQRGL